MSQANTFEFTPMVRVCLSYPNVNEKERLDVSKVIYDREINRFRGGGGGPYEITMYIPADEVEGLRQRLIDLDLGFVQYEELDDSLVQLESTDDESTDKEI